MRKISTLLFFVLLTCFTASAQNFLINGDFEDATLEPWWVFVDASNAAASVDSSAGSVNFEEITNPGGNTYDIQLIQELSEDQIAELADNLNETYHLSLTAIVPEDRNCNLFFGEIGGSWTNLAGGVVFNFTSDQTEYTHDIHITSTFDAMKFGLEIGTSDVPVEFDNISMTLVVVDDLDSKEIDPAGSQVYPNPVSDVLHVYTKAGNTISLISTAGVVLRSEVSSSDRGLEFDVRDLAAGIYILQIQTGQETEQQRILVQ